MAGRVLGSNLQEKLDDLLAEDPELCCPVSLMLYTDPMVASDGFMYNKDSLEQLIRTKMPSPMTRETLDKQYFPARERKRQCLEYREMQSEKLLAFAEQVLAEEPQLGVAAVERVEEYLGTLTRAKAPALFAKYTGVCSKLGRQISIN